MKALVTSIIASGLLASGVAYAQTKTVTGETQTVNATVEAIDQSRREVTLKKDDGTYEVLNVPKSVKRFDALKVGDTLKVRYYENIVLRLKPEGEPEVNTASGGVVPGRRREADGHDVSPAHDHGEDHGHRPGYPVDSVHRPERLELHHARAGQGRAREGEGRRPRGHHVDGGRGRRVRRADEEITVPVRRVSTSGLRLAMAFVAVASLWAAPDWPEAHPPTGQQPKRPAGYSPFRYPRSPEQIWHAETADQTSRAAAARADMDAVIAKGPFKGDAASIATHKTPEWFLDAKFGMFVDWGPWSVAGWAPQAEKATYPDWYEQKLFKEYRDYHVKTWGADIGPDDLIELLGWRSFRLASSRRSRKPPACGTSCRS